MPCKPAEHFTSQETGASEKLSATGTQISFTGLFRVFLFVHQTWRGTRRQT